MKSLNKNVHVISSDSDKISLLDLFILLSRNIKIILIIPTITTILSVIYVKYLVTPIYESNAKVISIFGGENNSMSGIAAQLGINVSNTQNQVNLLNPSIIKSRTIAYKMLGKKFDTRKFGSQKYLFHILSGLDKRSDDELAIKLAASTFIDMIETEKKGDIFIITIGSIEAELSKQLVESLVEELKNYQIEHTTRRNREARLFIEGRIIDTEKELKKAEELLKDFRDRNRRIENSPALQLEQQRLNREVSVLTGVFTTLKQQLETTKIEEVKEANSFAIIDKPEAPVFYSKPNKMKIVLFFGLLGIVLGIFSSYFIETFKSLNKSKKEKINKIYSILINNLNLGGLVKKKIY